jgi:phage terminase large subunit-like protein
MAISSSDLDKLTTHLDSLHPTTRYAVEVVSGMKVVCKAEWQACERHLRDLQRAGTDHFPYVFDETRADRVFGWFERCCHHVRGPFSGELIELQAFQKFDLGCTFGWVHKDTGRRRFKKAFHMRARGNVKSTEMSGLALFGMCGDCLYPPGKPELRQFEESPEVECAAVDREQAKRVWGDAKSMGEASPDILKRLRIKRTYIEHISRKGFMRPLSKDTKNKDGGAPVLVIIDEYHAHPTSEIHDVLWSSFGKRAQSLMEIITTAGKDAENNPCKKECDHCRKILAGEIIDETYFVMIRELDKEDSPHDEKVWPKANPILQEDNDYSRTLLEQIRTEHDAAYASGDPSKIREFLTKRCDLWQASSEEKYMDGLMDTWKELAVSRHELAELIHGRECLNGDDLSKRVDLTGTGFVIPLEDGRVGVTAHGFIPEESVSRHEQTDRVPYRHWANENWCTITPGGVTDYDYIQTHIHDRETDDGLRINEVCCDPYNATQFMTNMAKDGYTTVDIRQGMLTLSEPTKRFRELIIERKIVHDGNPLLTWCLSNAMVITDNNGNIRLSKKHKDDSQRIDLVAAIINAMVRLPAMEDGASVYEERGVISV